MELTGRESWAIIHGMVLGAVFLLAFAGGLAGLWSLRPEYVTVTGMRERMHRLIAGTWIMAIVAWLTLIVGTYIVYPWYRAEPPKGADLTNYPRSYLLSKPNLAEWHSFGMEFKEHIAWFAGPLATAAAFIVLRYGLRLAREDGIRKAAMVVLTAAFAAAGIAGLLGALITKAAPIR